MKLLVTGAFGNVGESTLEALLERDYEITCFDKRTISNRRTARRFRKKVKIIWGDLRDKKKVFKAVENQDVVLHIGAVIPPEANKSWLYTRDVNFHGTKHVVDACLSQEQKPRIIYTSSVALYGDIRHLDNPVLTEEAPINISPGDIYGESKKMAEEYVRNSGLDWVVFRLSYIPNPNRMSLTPLMFEMPLDTPIEFCHTKDCGLALANAIDKDVLLNKVHNLGGGESCQVLYKEFLEKMLPFLGIDSLPEEAFGTNPFHCCFYDTKKLNELLQFQRHSIDDLVADMMKNVKLGRVLSRMLSPIIKAVMLSQSYYYKRFKREQRKTKIVRESATT